MFTNLIWLYAEIVLLKCFSYNNCYFCFDILPTDGDISIGIIYRFLVKHEGVKRDLHLKKKGHLLELILFVAPREDETQPGWAWMDGTYTYSG